MQEQLKREFNQIYLILESEENAYEETYELEMITQNDLQTILPLRILRIDGRLQLSYEVTAKQTLKSYTERQKLSGQIVQALLQRLEALTHEVKDFLLDLESVLLDLEHIYIKEDEIYFCYCPWIKKDALDMLRGMMEEVLGVLDYHDIKSVELSYHLYQDLCKGKIDITEILEAYEKEQMPGILEEEPAYTYEKAETEPAAEPENSFKPQIFQRLLKFFLKKQEPSLPWEEKKQEEAEDTSFSEISSPTLFLNPASYRVWRLRPLSGGFPEFVITGESFLVGKKKELVDGWIEKDTVSRVHSRFYIREGRLFVTDANSTNGTYINGIAVKAGCETEIFAGDSILFADVGYECYNSL